MAPVSSRKPQITDPGFLEIISELVDESVGDKPANFEGYDYENLKKLSILGAVQSYMEMQELDVDDVSKQLSIISVLAFLIMENTVLWMDNQKMAAKILAGNPTLH